LPNDILSAGFILGKLENVLETQAYISNTISVGDEVELVLADDYYTVCHAGRVIGCLDIDAYFELLGIARESIRNSIAPPYLSPVFVTSIATMPYGRFHDDMSSYYRTTKFWLGVEISGFPEIDWQYAEGN
jgi:hypothetical protein